METYNRWEDTIKIDPEQKHYEVESEMTCLGGGGGGPVQIFGVSDVQPSSYITGELGLFAIS